MLNSPQIAMIDIQKIHAGERLRPIDMDYVEVLKASILERGLKTPIHVRPARKVSSRDSNRWTGKVAEGFYDLISGGHRLYACRELGHDQIAAIVYEPSPLEARLDEIFENLHRYDLTALDRAIFLGESKQVYEELHPETKNGAQGGHGGQKNENGTLPFTQKIAEKIRFSKRTIERGCRIYDNMARDVRIQIAGTQLARSQSELLNLVKHGAKNQKLIVEQILDEDNPVKTVKAAADILLGHTKKNDVKEETRLNQFEDAWHRLTTREKNNFLEKLAKEGYSLPDLQD